MTRYVVVRTENQRKRLLQHHLLGFYYGHSIDSSHMLLLAHIDPRHLATLESDPAVWVAPSVFADTTLQAHAQSKGRTDHYRALRIMGIQDGHKLANLAEMAAQKYGPKLSLEL